MVSLETHLKRARKKRWEGKTADQKKAAVSNAGKAYWSKLTPEERSAENKRRAAKRKKGK
jgi:hypothetical protein